MSPCIKQTLMGHHTGKKKKEKKKEWTYYFIILETEGKDEMLCKICIAMVKLPGWVGTG